MSIDMSQFFQVFFEECAEHLASIENLLLELDPSDPDPEQLNAIFRAAHSIKGGAGAFKLDALVSFAHVFETSLDRVRSAPSRVRPMSTPS